MEQQDDAVEDPRLRRRFRSAIGSFLREHRWPTGGFAALTIFFFWPVVPHLTTKILGNGGDSSLALWLTWWFPEALFSGQNPFGSSAQFYPAGVDLAFTNGWPLESTLLWPVTRLLGVAAAANIMMLTAAFLSAIGAYLLALHVTGHKAASFFAGVAFAFAPYRLFHAQGHYHIANTEFLPFGVLAALLLYERPTRGRAMLLGGLIGLSFLTDYTNTVFLLLACALVALWRWRQTFTRDLVLRLAQAAMVALAISLVLIVPLANAYLNRESDPFPALGGAELFSTDALAWVLPLPAHPALGRYTESTWPHLRGGYEGMAYPGLSLLLLAAVGAIFGARGRRGLWLLLAGAMSSLAFGPFLQFNGRTGTTFQYMGFHFSVPMPYLLMRRLPFLSFIRAPGRFAIPAILGFAVLAALGLARMLAHRRRVAAVAIALVTGILIFEQLPGSIPTFNTAVPAAYQAIARDPDKRAVLSVPLQWRTGFTSVGDPNPLADHSTIMYYATHHKKPMSGGSVSHYPRHRFRELFAVRPYIEILAMQGERRFRAEPGAVGSATFSAQDLQRLGVGFVACHRVEVARRACAYLAAMRLPVLADDGAIVVWKVPPTS